MGGVTPTPLSSPSGQHGESVAPTAEQQQQQDQQRQHVKTEQQQEQQQKQNPTPAPSSITPAPTASEAAPAVPLTKNAQKKLVRRARLAERKAERKQERRRLKAERKIEKRDARQAHLDSLDPQQRDAEERARKEARQKKRADEQAQRKRVRDALDSVARFAVIAPPPVASVPQPSRDVTDCAASPDVAQKKDLGTAPTKRELTPPKGTATETQQPTPPDSHPSSVVAAAHESRTEATNGAEREDSKGHGGDDDDTVVRVCIDVDWPDVMDEREEQSLARQLAYSYNALRKAVMRDQRPVALSVVGLSPRMRTALDYVSAGWQAWPVTLRGEALTAVHDARRVVYLTYDAEEVLDRVCPDDVYVIGGLVDRNRLKGATLRRAQQLGVRARRLSLDEEVRLAHGTPVLTVNHCVDILVHAANGKSWRDAYLAVLPVRKGIATNDTPGGNEGEVDNDDEGGERTYASSGPGVDAQTSKDAAE